MAPGLSIQEQIVAAIATGIATITDGATYSFTPAAVVRPNRMWSNVSPADKVVVITQSDDLDPDDEKYLEGNPPRRQQVMNVQVLVFCIDDDSSTDAIETLCNERKADIRTWFMTGTNNELGGLALKTSTWGNASLLTSPDGTVQGVIAPLEIHYRTSELDTRIQG